jgi:hypothetical protein
MSKPTRAEIIERALQLLRASFHPSALPRRLMNEFLELSSAAAREIAGAAIERWRAEQWLRGKSKGGKKARSRGD